MLPGRDWRIRSPQWSYPSEQRVSERDPEKAPLGFTPPCSGIENSRENCVIGRGNRRNLNKGLRARQERRVGGREVPSALETSHLVLAGDFRRETEGVAEPKSNLMGKGEESTDMYEGSGKRGALGE